MAALPVVGYNVKSNLLLGKLWPVGRYYTRNNFLGYAETFVVIRENTVRYVETAQNREIGNFAVVFLRQPWKKWREERR